MSLEIPEGAKQEEQIKYEEGLKEVVNEIMGIFKEKQFLLHDVNNVLKLLNIRITKLTSLLNINYIENSVENDIIKNEKEEEEKKE